MWLVDKLLGRELATSEEHTQALGVATGVPVLGLDSLASTGYGPEAALTLLLPLGASGLRYMPLISLGVVFTLAALYMSYRQTVAAYPGGGGAYIVAKKNLGVNAGLSAAIALLLDYLLNVAVAISSGVGAVVSAIPALHEHRLALCLAILASLALINLRGVRESGTVFILPVAVFVGCMTTTIAIGLARYLSSGGHPIPVVAPPPMPAAASALNAWILLGAFANGCTAMTGVEAVSNGVPLFREPKAVNAQRTLTSIVAILTVFLMGISVLSPAYVVHAMSERQPGYQTILSQLVAAVAGRGIFYYVALGSIFIILTYSAQTSFVGFPRVCRLLAEDSFLPHTFANKGRRLVFETGILALAFLSGLLLIFFDGVTERLIPLFAVGAFSAFLLSQIGMVLHWWRKDRRAIRTNLIVNAAGATTTALALAIILIVKFAEGAWIVVVVAPVLFALLTWINRHYRKIEREVEWSVKLRAKQERPVAVVVPISGWDRIAEKAIRYSLQISDDVTAVHSSTEEEEGEHLRELWTEKVVKPAKQAKIHVPRLEILPSPFRRIFQPLLDYIDKTKKEKPDRLIVVVIPHLVQAHWYGYLLHNLHASTLRTLLFLRRDPDVLVVDIPWYLRED